MGCCTSSDEHKKYSRTSTATNTTSFDVSHWSIHDDDGDSGDISPVSDLEVPAAAPQDNNNSNNNEESSSKKHQQPLQQQPDEIHVLHQHEQQQQEKQEQKYAADTSNPEQLATVPHIVVVTAGDDDGDDDDDDGDDIFAAPLPHDFVDEADQCATTANRAAQMSSENSKRQQQQLEEEAQLLLFERAIRQSQCLLPHAIVAGDGDDIEGGVSGGSSHHNNHPLHSFSSMIAGLRPPSVTSTQAEPLDNPSGLLATSEGLVSGNDVCSVGRADSLGASTADD